LTTPREGLFRDSERNNLNELNRFLRTPTGREADQLAIYKRGRGVELGASANNPS